MSSARIGLGIDTHRLVDGRPCVLGGVRIEHNKGPAGHSDGDAVIHAVCDACLGAAGLDDLGSLFPDSDARWKDADSTALAREVAGRLERAGVVVQSIDIVVEAEAPRIGPHRGTMRARIAGLFGLATESVNVKGKSAEGMGEIGRGEAVRATAVVLCESQGDGR